MISQNQIARLVDQQEYRQVVDRVLSNGRCRSRMAQRVLTRSDVVCPAAIGLALQRVAEITYSQTEVGNDLARTLLSMQRQDGLFGSGENLSTESLLAGSAAAIRGLLTWVSQANSSGLMTHSPYRLAIERGLAAIAKLYASSQDIHAEAVGWAIVLWQLGDHADFRRAMPVHELLAAVEDSGADIVETELCRYAHAMAA